MPDPRDPRVPTLIEYVMESLTWIPAEHDPLRCPVPERRCRCDKDRMDNAVAKLAAALEGE